MLTIASAFIAISYDKSSRLIFSFALEQIGYDLDLGSINIDRSLVENSYFLDNLRINELEGETSFQANKITAHVNFLDLLRLDSFVKFMGVTSLFLQASIYLALVPKIVIPSSSIIFHIALGSG